MATAYIADEGFLPGEEAYFLAAEEAARIAALSATGSTDTTVKAQVQDKWGRSPNNPKWGMVPIEGDPEYVAPGGGDDDDAPPAGKTPAAFVPRTDARVTLRAMLKSFDLEALFDVLWNGYASGTVDMDNELAVMHTIKEEQAYKDRFSGNALRLSRPASQGGPLSELTPSAYLQLENYYKRVMQTNGLPASFYDQPSDFAKLIGGDVSPDEFQGRIDVGIKDVLEADPTVKQQLFELYGIDEAGLIPYFLNPEKALPLLRQQSRASRFGARAQELAGLGGFANKGMLENLYDRGITEGVASQGFSDVGRLGELRRTAAGEEDISDQQQVGAALGFDINAQRALDKKRRRRLGEFEAGGRFSRTTGLTSGSSKLAIGKSE